MLSSTFLSGIVDRSKKSIFRLAKKIPYVAEKINNELSKIEKDFQDDVTRRNKNVPYIVELPKKGKSDDEILFLVDTYLKSGKIIIFHFVQPLFAFVFNKNIISGDYEWKKGKVSGAVYFFDDRLIDLLTKVYGKASYTNPLHPDVFPGICKMEAEVVRITANLFHGGANACGTVNVFCSHDF